MNQPSAWYWLYRAYRRNVTCRLGFHGSRYENCSGVTPANYCEWGCGHVFNPNAYQTWIVTLKSGETFEVQAINAYHAGSVVMYGANGKIDGRTGRPMTAPQVHRDNILSAVPKATHASGTPEPTLLTEGSQLP